MNPSIQRITIICSGFLSLFLSPREAATQGNEVELMLMPSRTQLSECEDYELEVALVIRNPGRLEIGGIQAFLRFPAEIFEPVDYRQMDLAGLSFTNGPEPFGVGYPGCDLLLDDPWDDGLEKDTVSVVSLAKWGEDDVEFINSSEAILGAFTFRLRPGATVPDDPVFFTLEPQFCHSWIPGGNLVVDSAGEPLEVIYSVPQVQVEILPGARVRELSCQKNPSDTGVLLSWKSPGTAISGVNIYRNGELIRTLEILIIKSIVDDQAPPMALEYEVAVLVDGVEDDCRVSCSIDLTGQAASFIRGDANRDGGLDISDPISVSQYLFLGGPAICEDAADVDDTGQLDSTDIINIAHYLLRGNPVPAAPFPGEGVDPTPDDLGCMAE